MIFDTDVIIWAQRSRSSAITILESDKHRGVSVVSYMEFIQYARTKREMALSQNFFHQFKFDILPITANISHRAATFIEQFSHSHSIGITDALIAATAYECGLPLATSNYKDYQMIDGLEIKKLKVA